MCCKDTMCQKTIDHPQTCRVTAGQTRCIYHGLSDQNIDYDVPTKYLVSRVHTISGLVEFMWSCMGKWMFLWTLAGVVGNNAARALDQCEHQLWGNAANTRWVATSTFFLVPPSNTILAPPVLQLLRLPQSKTFDTLVTGLPPTDAIFIYSNSTILEPLSSTILAPTH